MSMNHTRHHCPQGTFPDTFGPTHPRLDTSSGCWSPLSTLDCNVQCVFSSQPVGYSGTGTLSPPLYLWHQAQGLETG